MHLCFSLRCPSVSLNNIISRHYKKSLLRSQIYHGYEELSTDTNYLMWRRQERKSKYEVQLASWQLRSNSPKMSVGPSHLFHYVPVIVSSWNFQELLPLTKVMSVQKVKVRGKIHRNLAILPLHSESRALGSQRAGGRQRVDFGILRVGWRLHLYR